MILVLSIVELSKVVVIKFNVLSFSFFFSSLSLTLSAHAREGYSSHFFVQHGISKKLIISPLNGYCLEAILCLFVFFLFCLGKIVSCFNVPLKS